MKAVKFAVFALSLGFFAASCGNTENNETNVVDSSATMEPQPETAPAEPTPAPTTDSTATTTTTTTTVDTVKK